jgi:hypothetical protein
VCWCLLVGGVFPGCRYCPAGHAPAADGPGVPGYTTGGDGSPVVVGRDIVLLAPGPSDKGATRRAFLTRMAYGWLTFQVSLGQAAGSEAPAPLSPGVCVLLSCCDEGCVSRVFLLPQCVPASLWFPLNPQASL